MARPLTLEGAAHDAVQRGAAGLEDEVRDRVGDRALGLRRTVDVPLDDPQVFDERREGGRWGVAGEPNAAGRAAWIDDAAKQLGVVFFQARGLGHG
jgi:hypothetical protein